MTAAITGTRRNEPFLALDKPGLACRDRCIFEIRRRYNEARAAGPGNALLAAFSTAADGMTVPRANDLVLELTRALWSPDQRLRMIGFGYLVARRGPVWYVQYGPDPDDICEWENCSFLVVPDSEVVGSHRDTLYRS